MRFKFLDRFKKTETPTVNPYQEEITKDELDRFMAIHGDRGVKTLSLAGMYRPFKDAIKSEVGALLLHDAMVRMEILLDKITELKANDKEKIEYKILKGVVLAWSKKISIYNEAKDRIKKGEI